MRYVKRAAVILFVVLAVVVGALLIYARSSAARRHLRAFILHELNEEYRLPVDIEDVDLTIYPPSITLRGIRVYHPTEGTFMEARALTVTPEVWPLLHGRYKFEEIALEEPVLRLRVRGGRIVNLPEPRRPPGKDDATPVIDAFALVNGTLDMEVENESGSPALLHLRGVNLDLTGDRNEVFEVRALATGGSVRWGDVERPVERFEARIGITPSEARVRKLIVRLGDDVALDVVHGRIALSGKPRARVSATLRAPLSILGRLPDSLGLPDLAGDLGVAGWIEYGEAGEERGPVPRPGWEWEDGEKWRSGWNVVVRGARAPGLPIGNVAGTIGVGSNGIRATGLAIDTGIGRLEVDANLHLGEEGLPFDARIRMRDLRFAELLERLGVPRSKVVQTFDGTLTAAGTTKPFRISAKVDTDVRDFATFDDSFRFDGKGEVLNLPRSHLTGGIDLDRETLVIVPTKAHFGGTHLDLTGSFAFADRRFTLDIDCDPIVTTDIGHLVGPPISGAGPLHTLIDGPIARPVITAEMSLRDFRFIGKAFGDVRASLHYSDRVLGFPEIRASTGESSYDVLDLTFDFTDEHPGRWTATARIRPGPVRLKDIPRVFMDYEEEFADYDGWFDGDVDLAYRSWTREFDVRFDLRGRRVSVRGEPIDAMSATGRYRGGTLHLPHVRLERLGGWVEGSASVTPSGRFTASLTGGDMPIDDLFGGVVGDLGLEAAASFQADVEGQGGSFTGAGRVDLAGAVLLDQQLGDVNLGFRIEPGELVRLWGTAAAGGLQIDALADLTPHLRVGINASFTDFAPLPFLRDPRTDPYGLTISGRTALALDVPERDGVRVDGKADLSEIVLTSPQGTVRSVGPVWLAFTQDGVDVRQAVLEVPGGSRVSVLGHLGRDALDVDARGEADAATVLGLFPGAPPLEGHLEFGARLTGTPDEPVIDGRARLTGGRLSLGEEFGFLDNIAAEARFTPERLYLESLTADMLGGRARAEGDVLLAGLDPQSYDVSLDFGGMTYQLTDSLPAGFDGTVRVTGDRSGGFLPLVTGDVYITRLLYTDPMRLGVSLGTLGRAQVEPIPTFRPQDDFVRFDVRLHGDSGIGVRNNVLEATARIDETGQPFRVVGTNQIFGLVGTAVIEHGRLRWRRSVFDVTRGVVTFDSPWKIDPRFDVVAETEIRDWRITLTASGRRDDLSILTTAQPDLSQEDVVLLLAIGMTREEAEMIGTGGTVGGALLTEMFGEAIGVSDRLDRLVPIVDQMRLTTEYSSRTGRSEPRILVGRRITDDVRIEATSSLNDTRDFRAVFSYEVTDRMSLEGVYDNNNDSQFGNVGADVRWRMEF